MHWQDLNWAQINLLQRIVQCDQDRKLAEEGLLALIAGDDKYVIFGCGEIDTLNDLNALCGAGLLIQEQTGRQPKYRILNSAYIVLKEALEHLPQKLLYDLNTNHMAVLPAPLRESPQPLDEPRQPSAPTGGKCYDELTLPRKFHKDVKAILEDDFNFNKTTLSVHLSGSYANKYWNVYYHEQFQDLRLKLATYSPKERWRIESQLYRNMLKVGYLYVGKKGKVEFKFYAYEDSYWELMRPLVEAIHTKLLDYGIMPSEEHQTINRQQKRKGGRPRNPDDDWAWKEVNEKNRSRAEVFAEWLKLIGQRASILSDPQDSFNKAVSVIRGKGIERD